MNRRFVPEYYKQELYLRMQGIRQGGMSVEDYVKEFETLAIRCELTEPQEQTIARFLGGLNREIADVVELQPFVFLEDVIKLAIKVERQRKKGRAPLYLRATPKPLPYNAAKQRTTLSLGHSQKKDSPTTIAKGETSRGKEKL